MCLGIPGRVVETYRELDLHMAKVDFGGVFQRVCLEHVAEAQVGDYVIVHVGFALSRIDEVEAQRVFDFLDQMNQLDWSPLSPGTPGERGRGEGECTIANAAPSPPTPLPRVRGRGEKSSEG